MLPGLLVALALGVPPDGPAVTSPTTPAAEAHKDAVARFGAALLNARRDRLLTAARQMEAAAKQDPDATAPLRELVRIYSQIGREPDAIRVARQILAKDPGDVEIAHSLARLLFDAGELKDAVAAAKIAAEAPFPADRADKAVAVYRDLATLCEKADDAATAEAAIRKALTWLTDKRKDVIAAGAFSPREADAAAAECRERLGKVLVKLRRFDDAAEAFAGAAKFYADPLKGNDPGAAARLGWNLSGVLQAKGEPAAAIKQLEPFLRLHPVAADPYSRYAKLLRESGRGAELVEKYERYADADADNLALKIGFAVELARDDRTRTLADELFATVMTKTNEQQLVAAVVRSFLETKRPREVIGVLDRAFAVLKDRDEKKEEKPDTPAAAAARAFAADKARAIAAVLRDDRDATVAVLGAAAEDARTGTKRTQGVHYFLAQLAARHHELALAAHHFQNAVRGGNRETIGDAYAGLINVLVAARKPAELKRVCQEALRGIETNGWPLAPHYFNYYLASALAELGDENGAIAAVDQCILQTADGDRLTVRLQKIFILRSLEKWDDAVEYGKRVFDEFEGKADRARIRYALAGAYWGARKPAEAERELRAILADDPDNAAACNDLAFHLADQGRDLEEAEQLARRALAADRTERRRSAEAEPDNGAHLDTLGWVLFRQGKLAEARATLERAAALHLGATDPVVWDHLGDVQFRQGEKVLAKASWTRAAEMYEADLRVGARGRRDGRLDELKRKLKRVP